MTTHPNKYRPVRSAGILLHPTSLPGPHGIGDFGRAAYAWVDALAIARQTWWQVLPLSPPGPVGSPYQSFSAFAGNPFLISLQALVEDGLLRAGDLTEVHYPEGQVNPQAFEFKTAMLTRAWENFQAGMAPTLRLPFTEFCGQHRAWLNDFALFLALKDSQGGVGWLDWPAELRLREPAALKEAARELADAIGRHQFSQFLFTRQWQALRRYAHQKGIRIIGDLPIFVAEDSAEVWAHPEWFLLDAQRRPAVVAGTPPDYFSETGQLWGNPLYNWERLRQTGYAWWVARFRALLDQVDYIRLDHFRGFEAYWEIPAGSLTAQAGRWVKGPGAPFFEAMRQALGGLPIIAEDLGLITPEVEALRRQFDLPGMRVLQFAFGSGTDNPYLPHRYEYNTVVYTGTHDNDTTCGWYEALPKQELAFLRRYLVPGGDGIAWDLIRLAWKSVADYAIVPLQDVLSLGTEARMNVPGKSFGNWSWRFTEGMLTEDLLLRLRDLTETYERA